MFVLTRSLRVPRSWITSEKRTIRENETCPLNYIGKPFYFTWTEILLTTALENEQNRDIGINLLQIIVPETGVGSSVVRDIRSRCSLGSQFARVNRRLRDGRR